MKTLSPQEIFEYKLKWAPGHLVDIHSDLDWKAKDWCRKHIDRQRWSMDTYTDVYLHTFRFEREKDAIEFSKEFSEWVRK